MPQITLDLLLDAASWGLLSVGGLVLVIGGIGILRFPDFYSRLHATGAIDTLGADLMLLGMALQAGFSMVTVKLILIGLFLFFTSPTSTHAAANAALAAGLKPEAEDETGMTAQNDGGQP